MPILKTYHKVIRALPDPDYFYVENIYAGNNTFHLEKSGTPSSTDLQYSLDKNTWVDFDLTKTTNTVTIPQGGKIYLRGTTGFSNSINNYFRVYTSSPCEVGGNLLTLLDYTNMNNVSIPNYAFYDLFDAYGAYPDYATRNARISNKLNTNGAIEVGENSFNRTFSENSDPSVRYIDLSGMFKDVTTAKSDAFNEMCKAYSSTSTQRTYLAAPSFENLTNCPVKEGTASYSQFAYTYQNCQNLEIVYAPNINVSDTTITSRILNNWLLNTNSGGIVVKGSNTTLLQDSASGVPTGWTVENY